MVTAFLLTANDERPTANDQRRTTTTNDQRRTHDRWRSPEYTDNAAAYGQRLGDSQSSGQGTGPGAGADQRDHAGHGVDDRVGNFYCVGRDWARGRLTGAADRGLGRGRVHDHCGRAQLRRTGGDDAASRRAVCLSARGAGAAVGVAFGKFLGVFFPAISSTHWILHLWKVPPIPIGPMVLGNMDVGINTQNLMAILLVIFLSIVTVLGEKTGALIQNVFTVAKVSALLGLALFGLALGRNAAALAANFNGHFWQNAGLGAQHAVQVGVGGPVVMVGTLTILAVAQVGSLFSADAWNNVTFTAGEVKNPSRNLPLSLALGTGVVIALYIACNVIYLMALPLEGASGAATVLARGIQYAAEDRVGTAVMTQMFGAAGGLLM